MLASGGIGNSALYSSSLSIYQTPLNLGGTDLHSEVTETHLILRRVSMEPASDPERSLMKDDDGPNPAPAKCYERGQWANKREFLLAVVGEIIGLGNVWRFPYLCFKNGGGAFLVPYVLFLLTCGIPIFFLEVSLGQLTGQGEITCWRKICPLFEGVGYGGQMIMLYTNMYYIVILAWAFLYLFSSFHTALPWASCNNTWNTGTHLHYDGAMTLCRYTRLNILAVLTFSP